MNHSVCKTDNTLELHPTSPIPVGYRDEISVINVFRVGSGDKDDESIA